MLLKLIQSITTLAWVAGLRHVHCSSPGCPRWLTHRHLTVRRVGVSLGEAWYCSYKCAAAAVHARLAELMYAPSRQSQRSFRMPLGLMLVHRGRLTEEQLRVANERQRQSGRDMGDVLLELGFADETQVTDVRSSLWSCPVYTPPPRALPSSVTVPAALLRSHAAVVLPTQTDDKLLVGYLHHVNYGLLYAIEQVTECKVAPCFLTPSEHAARLRAQTQTEEEREVDDVLGLGEMARAVCQHGARLQANEIVMVRCNERLWVRLKGGPQPGDLLFRTS